MNINDVVAHALKIRENAKPSERMSLEADADTERVELNIYPFNGLYVEQRIGGYRFYIHENDIKYCWIN